MLTTDLVKGTTLAIMSKWTSRQRVLAVLSSDCREDEARLLKRRERKATALVAK